MEASWGTEMEDPGGSAALTPRPAREAAVCSKGLSEWRKVARVCHHGLK